MSSSAEAAIIFGRPQMFDVLRVAEMPELGDHIGYAHDSTTLKALVAIRPPSDWSKVILAFVREMCPPWRDSSWDAREALGFIGSCAGKLTAVSSDELRWMRREMLDLPHPDDFLWLLKWLTKEQHCEPAIFHELTRTKSMREKMEALNAGARYLTPHQKMSRANDRRRRAAERKSKGASSADK